MNGTTFENTTYWDPVWTWSLSPFLGLAFLFMVEKWFLSAPATMPWMGSKSEIFPRIAACLRDRKESMTTLKSGYSMFGSKGTFSVKPDMAFMPEIMVPREHIRWVLDQPHDVLSVHEARYEKFALEYVLPGHDAALDQIFLDTIHRKLTRNLLKLQGALTEEISRDMDAALGTDTENWVEVSAWGTVEKTVFSALMRILVGQSVCREEDFRADLSGFTKAFGYNSIFVGRFLPRFLRSTLGWLLSTHILLRQRALLKKWFIPLVDERFTNLLKKNQDSSFDYTPPEDLVTWASDALLRTGNAERCSPSDLSRRLAIMIPAAVPAIKSTTTNVIYDILSADPDMKLQEHLHNEISNALDASPGKGWADQSLIPRLVFLNSTIRETLRVNPVSVVTLERKVNAKEGVTLPSGQHLPRGTWLGVPTLGVHYDENIYTNAAKYEPFRHVNRKPGQEPSEKDAANPVKTAGVVNVTDTFLPFGAGKYACPGRWLASHVIELSIAYLLYNYEIKPFAQRPLNHAIFGTNMPDRQATMMIRRRKH